jgi:hypothetical protein
MMEVYAEVATPKDLSACITHAQKNMLRVTHVEVIKAYDSHSNIGVILTLRIPRYTPHADIVNNFSKLDGIVFVEEV